MWSEKGEKSSLTSDEPEKAIHSSKVKIFNSEDNLD
jgi:hypothetical protein